MGAVFAHPCSTRSGGKWHEWRHDDPPLCALERARSLDTKGRRDRRGDVCEMHHTAANLAQSSVNPHQHQQHHHSTNQNPSYTFLSRLLRALQTGFLFTAPPKRSTPVIILTGSSSLRRPTFRSSCDGPRSIPARLELGLTPTGCRRV